MSQKMRTKSLNFSGGNQINSSFCGNGSSSFLRE
jgi:hypothetical protein